MQSFLSDDSNINYFEDGSWMEAEELTTPSGSGSGVNQQSLVLHNTSYNSGGEGEDERDHEEMEIGGEERLIGKPAADMHRTSNF